jgi:hypothetical protein
MFWPQPCPPTRSWQPSSSSGGSRPDEYP